MKKLLLNFLLIICLFSSFFCFGNNMASAETKAYSNVISDLQKDENFNKEEYPINNNDYTLKVIQIAESVEQELFIYVYQPCYTKDLTATSINISVTIGDDLNFNNYKLSYINSKDTLFKYKVEDFEVSNLLIRYYEISSIFRLWDETIDRIEDKVNDNTITEIAFTVGKLYKFDGYDLSCQDIETIQVLSKYVGHIRYEGGFFLYEKSCDSHYVAFTTDKQIDKLIAVEIAFKTEIKSTYVDDNGKTDSKKILLTEDENFVVQPLWHKEKLKNRIETVESFVNNEELKDKTKEELLDKEWVLRFYESDYSYNAYGYQKPLGVWHPAYRETNVSEVTILRLNFETAGKVYNLGTVDNKQTGSEIPSNPSLLKKIFDFFGKIFKGIFNFIVNFFKSLPLILKIILYTILGLCGGALLYWIIKSIVSLIKKQKNKKQK